MKHVNVVIANKTDKTDRFYTYGCEFDQVRVGSKVHVPFGQGDRIKEAYVFEVTEPEEGIRGLKYVESIDPEVELSDEAVRTAAWMTERYLCRYIDAINCFIPAGKPSARGKKRNPYEGAEGSVQKIEKLTEEQQKALVPIREAIDSGERQLFLLHGVTGSGKTELYMQAIAEAISRGKSAIMLVPEISLTKQIIERFIGRFGAENIAVLHSRLSLGERYDEWMRIKSGQVKIVIGARSAVFAPLENIGIIVMDEEHESTYKSDMSPKYETVEVAIKRLSARGGTLLMGSATPSVVSYNRAKEGIYRLLELKERYNKVQLPEVEIADMRKELREGNLSIFSRALYSEIKEVLARGEKVILFLNRRGYSNIVTCRECGETVKCPVCGISLTYHKTQNKMNCHYCGHSERVPAKCPSCGSKYIKHFGIGTEQVQEAAEKLFEGASIKRLDLDTVKAKGSIEKMLTDFEKGKTDILIGTQLVAKGLDFRNVGLVGIISADVTLNIPDFRSTERTFQLITQAAGRAGRGDRQGRVIIQTYTPDNYAIEMAARHDYAGFYREENGMRKLMKYPPYSDLLQMVFSSKEERLAKEAGEKWRCEIIKALGSDGGVFPVQPAPMNRIKDTYRYSMLLKSPKGERLKFETVLMAVREKHRQEKKPGYTIAVDFNPYSFL